MIADATHRVAAELELLLQEPQLDARHRERTAFDRLLQASSGRVVIYGAGNLGRRILTGLRAAGTDVLAFADRNPRLWNERIDGLAVMDPQEAAATYGNTHLFIAAVWHPTHTGGMEHLIHSLQSLGCRHVSSFVPLFWRDADRYLPFYLWDLPSRALSASDRIRSAFQLFDGDSESQTLFIQQLRLRLQGTFECLTPPAGCDQYFPDLFRPLPDESFIDCGAFDGDSIQAFLAWTSGSFASVIAFEPDPANAASLRAFAQTRAELSGRMDVRTVVVGARTGARRFDASGAANAALSETGTLEVPGTTLDEALASHRPTFIKMDIEGEELAALRGARETIRDHRPILAICAYHLQDHLWEVPLLMAELLNSAHLSLLSHCMDGFDTVCYAIPKERYSGRSGAVR